VGHEAAAAAKAIEAVLSGNSSLNAVVAASKHFAESAPQSAVVPYIVFRQRSSGEDSEVFTKRNMTSPLIDVGVWVADNPYQSTAQVAAKQIDVSLGVLVNHSVTDANSDSWEVSARREGGAWIREEIDPKTMKKFYWVGGSYRFSISAA
jgi:hypothetical protein